MQSSSFAHTVFFFDVVVVVVKGMGWVRATFVSSVVRNEASMGYCLSS